MRSTFLGIAASLPFVASGHLPGPDALYAPAPRAPQLENVAPWQAPPILVSGASAYRKGEFLYQDYLYDDHGASGVHDPTDPFTVGDYLYSPKAGTLTYPTSDVYAQNAADLVELRARPLPDATAFRVTLNTLKDATKVGFTIAIGDSTDPVTWPHGAGVRSPAKMFLTVHGSTGELLQAGTDKVLGMPTVVVDLERRQFDVRIPHSVWDPGRSIVRLAAAVGLWGEDGYLVPGPVASASGIGGVAPSRSGMFNVAFRHDEPMPDLSLYGLGVSMADAAAGATLQARFWRERAQADALGLGDISKYFEQVDFDKLLSHVDDNSRVPVTGPMDRIFASRQSYGQGVDYTKLCGGLVGAIGAGGACTGNILGQLQPYAIYVPRKPMPAGGYGLTLLLHSLSANYNQYLDSRNQSQLGERGPGSIVVTASGRGPDGNYLDAAEGDTFDMWADVARHYKLDPSWSTVTGYSMGGGAVWEYLTRWPDLFARGFSTVGPRSTGKNRLAALRNTPVMAWAAAADELVNINETEATQRELGTLGLRFRAFLFPVGDHLSLATNDEYGPAADFLGTARVDRNPPHVTYVVEPQYDSERALAKADHAYWLSDMKVAGSAATATVDARSEAFGVGDPKPTGVVQSQGTLTGGARGPQGYIERAQDWGPAPATPKADKLVLRSVNLASVTVDAVRAKLSCAPTIDVQGSPMPAITLTCAPTVRPACAPAVAMKLPRVRGHHIVRAQVLRGTRPLLTRKGKDLRALTIRRPTTRAFTVRLKLTVSGRKARTVTVTRSFKRC